MADTKISALTAASVAALANELAINEAGTSKKLSVQKLADFFGNTLNNFSTADQTINAATSALITGSLLAVPAHKLEIGTMFKWRMSVSKTAAGTAANNFMIRVGTNGTVADAIACQFTWPVGTAVVDTGRIEIIATVRGPLSASGIIMGCLLMNHNLQITGLATIPSIVINDISGNIDLTVANLFVSLSCTTAASTVLTFQQVQAEAINL